MVVEQKVTSMTTLKIKSYLLGPILNNFQRGLGKKILPFHFLNLHHEFGNSFFSKFWHINQKKFMKQKRQQIDHRVAWRRPFLRFQLHFWDIVAGATHRRELEQPTEGRSNPPKAGATHRRCASPPPASRWNCMVCKVWLKKILCSIIWWAEYVLQTSHSTEVADPLVVIEI